MIPRFRAFECVTNTMWQSHEIDVCFRQDELYIEVPRGKNGAVYFGKSLNRITLMQSTGLFDKNGVEIFEGDVLGGIYDESYINYCDVCKQFTLHDNFGGNDYCYQCEGDIFWHELANDKNLEVISNIYENQELEVEE